MSLLTLAAFAAGVAFAVWHENKSAGQQQVAFLTNIYKVYLAARPESPRREPATGTFYSRATESAIANNYSLCERLSRSDGVCGYGADGDVFLQTQETSPDLNFQNARFVATKSGRNMVDVSFTTWPGQGVEADRTLRYVLAKESGGWRVVDVIPRSDGVFAAEESLRGQIAEENARLMTDAADLADTLGWIFVFLRQVDMADRVERFVAFPVEICERSGHCQSFPKGDAKLNEVVAQLRRTYYRGDEDVTTDWTTHFPQTPHGKLVDGNVAKLDALDLTFRSDAWWITRIDLRRLGTTMVAHR